jgi:hypothetical protein
MRHSMLRSVLVAVALAGCAGVAYRGTVAVETPDLVYVGPGVQVIADYDEPIFYADGFYWWYFGTTWYRSSYYTGGWIVASPPSVFVNINPHRYRHYRPATYVSHRRPVPSHRVQRPVVRDHRRR